MSQEAKAGQLILSQLKMFNEAVVLFENVINNAFEETVDGCVSSFSDDNDWVGKFELASKNKCWLAPKNWVINPKEKNPKVKSKFFVNCLDEENMSYWVAIFCGVPAKDDQAGFSFEVEPNAFGDKKTWSTCANQISPDLVSRLITLGFQNQGNGHFFLPVRLDNQLLADTWHKEEKFAEDDDCFAPLREALEKLNQAVPIFDKIMDSCTPASSTK